MRDDANDLALHFLAKKNIMVIRDIERDHVDFISKTCQLTPIAHIDHFAEDKLGHAKLCEEDKSLKVVRVTGCPEQIDGKKTVSMLVRGTNKLIVDEAERSLHDALCVVRSLVKKKAIVPGGAAVEMEVAARLMEHSKTIFGTDSYVVRAFAEALEIVPYTLAENAGLDPIKFVTKLRKAHMGDDRNVNIGLNVKKNNIGDMTEINVI